MPGHRCVSWECVSYRRLQWIFPFAVCLHNLEEALAYPQFLARHSADLKWAIAPALYGYALIALSLAAWIVTYQSWRQGPKSLAAHLGFGYAAAILLNVAAPHVPLAIWYGGYTPGLVTAVAVNLPCLTFLLARAHSEEYVESSKAAAASAAVAIGGALLIGLLSLISKFDQRV